MGKCRSCEAPIEWIKTVGGKSAPVDPPRKMYVKFNDGQYHLIDCFESHFATCPFANQHRRKKS